MSCLAAGRWTLRLAALAFTALVAAGCTEKNPGYCTTPGDPCGDNGACDDHHHCVARDGGGGGDVATDRAGDAAISDAGGDVPAAEGGGDGGGDGLAGEPAHDAASEDGPATADAPGTCSVHGECALGAPICMGGTCVGCDKMPSACAMRDAMRPLCDTASGTCVECMASGTCAAATAPVCAMGTCRGCAAAAECTAKSAGLRACLGTGQCVECDGSEDCPTPAAPICNTFTNACRVCQVAGECVTKSGGAQRGCTSAGVCVECTTNTQCTAAGAPICDATSNACRKCGTAMECSTKSMGALRACLPAGGCAECAADGDCGVDASKPICDSSNTCRKCGSPTECSTKSAGTLLGCTTAGACVECTDSSQCGDTAKPICDGSNVCRKCGSGSECSARSGGSLRGCVVASGTCVECTSSAECTDPTKPICNTAAHTCRACGADSECSARQGADPGVCVDGRCPSSGDVIYVKNAGSCPGTGTLAAPFCLPNDAVAQLKMGGESRRVIIMRGALGTMDLTGPVSGKVTVVGQGAVINPGAQASGVHLSQVTVVVRDVTVQAGTNAAGAAFKVDDGDSSTDATLDGVAATGNSGKGIWVSRAKVVTIQHAAVDTNRAGGIDLAATDFDVTNCFVTNNGTGGGTGSGIGGVRLGNTFAGTTKRFLNNTIYGNNADDGAGSSGVTCSAAYALKGLILYGNVPAAVTVGGLCVVTSSNTDVAALNGSSGNIGGDPAFVDSGGNYHLTSSSPCRDYAGGFSSCSAGSSNCPNDDIDGDNRPKGSRSDCGADEF